MSPLDPESCFLPVPAPQSPRCLTIDGSIEDALPMEHAQAGLSIRLATAEDSSSIASLLNESFKEYRRLYTRAAFAATTPSSEVILVRLKEGPIWVAVSDGTIMGTVSMVNRPKGMYIRSMAIRPRVQGRGIGWALLECVEDFARSNGCRRLFLSTTPFLKPAIRLYRCFGFQPTAEGPHDLHGTRLLAMEKELPPLGIDTLSKESVAKGFVPKGKIWDMKRADTRR